MEPMPDHRRQQIVDHIMRAIREGQAGADCDVDTWRHVADELSAL